MEKGAPLNLTEEQVAEVEKILATDEVLVNQLARRVNVYNLSEKSIDDIKNEIQKNDEDTPGPFYSEKKRYSVQSKSLLNQNSRVS